MKTFLTPLAALLVTGLVALGLSGALGASTATPPAGPVIDVVDVVDDELRLPGSADTLDRRVMLRGSGFYGTAFGPWVRFELPTGLVHEAEVVILHDAGTIEAWPPAGMVGSVTVVVENPDHLSSSRVVDF